MPSYWIIVSGSENFEATKAHGFSVQGMKGRQRKKAERMAPGDKIVWYITGDQAFAGFATITGGCFEDHAPIWKGKKEGEDYPWRVPISKDVALAPSRWVPAEAVARQMAHVSKWPPEYWRLAFQGNVHEIPEGDFELLRAEVEKAASEAA